MRRTVVLWGLLLGGWVSIVCRPGLLTAGPGARDAPAPGDVQRGAYLVTVGGCHDCHSPKRVTPNGLEPDPARLLSGYPAVTPVPEIPPGVIGANRWGGLFSPDFTAWAGPWGVSFAANLTPDPATGLGNWTEALFIQTMRTGKHLGVGRAILPPMPWFNYAQLSDQDLRAIFAYLRTLRPIVNAVPPPRPPAASP